MDITEGTLSALRDRDQFITIYPRFVTDVLAEARLFPKFAAPRLVDAHGAWKEDLYRVGEREPRLDAGLDHFKQCGHLVFWLRRMSPLVETIDLTQNIADAPGLPLINAEIQFRELLFGYANEYLAFDFGFQICKYYETTKEEPSARAATLTPGTDYYTVMCHFLKYKTVSPHALFLIYKSLFAD